MIFRGRRFNRFMTKDSSSPLTPRKSTPFGKYRRIIPFVFSFNPHSWQAEGCGSEYREPAPRVPEP